MTPEIVPSLRSSGVATLLAMVSGLAPGIEALTDITGKSTCGSGDTGSTKKGAYAAEGEAYGEKDCGYWSADEGF